jgi:uncharacterized protein (DUF1778 family)
LEEFTMTKLTQPRSRAAADSARINLRTSREAKALIERAAALMGTTVSGFMLQSSYESASRVVANHDALMLSARDFEAFMDACENPAEPTPALIKLMSMQPMHVRLTEEAK